MYDPVETLEWMIAEAAADLAAPSYGTEAAAKPRRKSKAVKQAEQVRLTTLVEALWNLLGRPVPLEEFEVHTVSRIERHAALDLAA